MSEDGPSPGRGEAPRRAAFEVEVVRHGGAWDESGISDAAVELAAHAAFAAGGAAGRGPCEATIVLTDDDELRELNRAWRGKDQPTNVLSFPTEAATGNACAPNGAPAPLGEYAHLGDVVIAFETARSEALENAVSVSDHVSHLAAHGILHLLGFDHVDDADAELMEDLERQALASLGIADPYATGEAPASSGETGLAEIVQ